MSPQDIKSNFGKLRKLAIMFAFLVHLYVRIFHI